MIPASLAAFGLETQAHLLLGTEQGEVLVRGEVAGGVAHADATLVLTEGEVEHPRMVNNLDPMYFGSTTAQQQMPVVQGDVDTVRQVSYS